MIAFAEPAQAAQAALLALGDGEAVALAGTLKVGTWQTNDGTHRPSLDLTAAQVLTAYHVTKRRKAMQPAEQEGGQQRQPYRRDDYATDPGELDEGRPLDF